MLRRSDQQRQATLSGKALTPLTLSRRLPILNAGNDLRCPPSAVGGAIPYGIRDCLDAGRGAMDVVLTATRDAPFLGAIVPTRHNRCRSFPLPTAVALFL